MNLPISQKIATFFVVLCLILLGFNPDSFPIGAAFLGSCGFFGFIFWAELEKKNEIKKVTDKLESLESRLDDLILKKSLSR